MIYFDNAATGGFKPRAVTDAAKTVISYLSANPGRSGHRLSVSGAKIVFDCRQALAKAFGSEPDRVIFTKNCTEALNLAIFGLIKKGDHVITTVYEHNSVLRPLFHLKNRGDIELDIIEPEQDDDLCQLILDKINERTKVIVTTAVSNVNGQKLPVDQIGALAKQKNLIYVVDGAQGGGHVSLNVRRDHISALALAGHKGLYGIMGSGALVLNQGVDVEPLLLGGTGSETFNLSQPLDLPERLEAGTLNLPAIAALNEGVRYIHSNLDNFQKYLLSSTALLIDGLKTIPQITCYSKPNESGIVAFSLRRVESTLLSDILSGDFDVAVRGGFHCAPLMHKHLKTDVDGLVRASLAVQNTSGEIHYLVRSLKKIAENY